MAFCVNLFSTNIFYNFQLRTRSMVKKTRTFHLCSDVRDDITRKCRAPLPPQSKRAYYIVQAHRSTQCVHLTWLCHLSDLNINQIQQLTEHYPSRLFIRVLLILNIARQIYQICCMQHSSYKNVTFRLGWVHPLAESKRLKKAKT